MSRTILAATAALGTSSLLLMDSAIKGGVILLIAVIVAFTLRRDSAATRHLVWLVAVVAMLVVPVLSLLLPQWRVLPTWAELSPTSTATEPLDEDVVVEQTTIAQAPVPAVAFPEQPPSLPRTTSNVETQLPVVSGAHVLPDVDVLPANAVVQAAAFSEIVAQERVAEGDAAHPVSSWTDWLPAVWAIVFLGLVLRLLAARLLLWSNERRGTVICVSSASGGLSTCAESDELTDAFADAYRQLGLRQRVSLLIYSERTIPVVWGILRCRLLLPTAARQWSNEQLRSVLLHELAHIKRRDTIVQLLAQFACALHWFNPLAWFAAWRLHVERERACDDLVLANGVRASSYAEHLLNVATRLSSSPWTQACGLAMARSSSLENRLRAVLNDKRNRRSVTTAIAVVSLMLGAGIAIPVAMLRAADEGAAATPAETRTDPSAGDKTASSSGKKGQSETDQPAASDVANKDKGKQNGNPAKVAVELKAKHADGQAVLQIWQRHARADGKIPGGLIGQLADWVKYFIELNDGAGESAELTQKFKQLLPRFDATKDWTLIEAVALLDAVADVHRIPLSNAKSAADERIILTGEPLPDELKNAPWGKPTKDGLRAAWSVEPRAIAYRQGSSLKTRILIHNSGKQPAFFVMPNWQQSSKHSARNADADESIKVTSTYWTTMARMAIYRLAPGAYCETYAPGIGVGEKAADEDWANVRVGSWILAKKGDQVRFTPGPVEVRVSPFVFGSRKGNTLQKPKNAAELWKQVVADRIQIEKPIPTGAADRELLLRRLVKDLYGLEPTPSEIAAFVQDKSPGALHPLLGADLLATRVQHNRNVAPFTGTLQPGDISFHVLGADPDAAKRPRVVTGPGWYNLAPQKRLSVERSRSGNRVVNKATIRFFSKPTPDPYPIVLPDGRLTFAIVWDPNATKLWVAQAGLVRTYDFTDPANITEARLKPTDLPERFREAHQAFPLRLELPKPTTGTKLDPGKVDLMQWGKPVNGLRGALIRPPALGQPEARQSMDFSLVVQNVSDAPIRFVANSSAPNPRLLTVRSRKNGWTLFRLRVTEPSQMDVLLQPNEVTVLKMVPPDHVPGTSMSRNLDLTFLGTMEIKDAPEGAWTGKLVTPETQAAFAAHGLLPKHKDAQRLFILWNQGIRWDRKIPGAHIGLLAESVKLFTKSNPTWKTTPQLLKMLPRLDATRDWEPHQALEVLDELVAVQASPIQARLEREFQRTIRTGKPLPEDLETAPWGEAHPSGLRMAWLLDPPADKYTVGMSLKSRILIHNSGKKDIVFRTRNWHQSSQHKATDAVGKPINTTSSRWTTRALLVPFRLKSGEFAEVIAAGIGIGSKGNPRKPDARVGAWIDAKPGDQVTFTPASVQLADWSESPETAGKPSWWADYVATRLSREAPVPADDEVRRRLVYHVTMDLFGTPLSADYTNAFLADRKPNALETLATRLAQHPRVATFTGSLQSGATKFLVSD